MKTSLALGVALAALSCRPEEATTAPAAAQPDRLSTWAPRDELHDEDLPLDSEIEATVSQRMRFDAQVDASRVFVDADAGKLQLFGSVASRDEKQRVIAIAWVEGVTDVDASQLEVSPFARGAHQPPPAARDEDDLDTERSQAGEVVFDPDR